jgi:hypothetical protein
MRASARRSPQSTLKRVRELSGEEDEPQAVPAIFERPSQR